jgi:hypothetical protein
MGRYQAAKVLTVFMEHTEKNATGYISVMLPTIYKVLAGDELQVMEQVGYLAILITLYSS